MVSLKARMNRPVTLILVAVFLLSLSGNAALAADPGLNPPTVEALVYPGEAVVVNKTVTTPTIPPKLDVCLLEDETGSFEDDIGNLQGSAGAAIYDTIVAAAPDSQFAVAGFRDYGDAWVYRLLSAMNPAQPAWLAGIAALTAGGGGDEPEAQYDAIVSAAVASPFGPNCGWRADPNVTHVLLVTTDAPFHVPPAPWVNDQATTIAALNTQNIRLIGLKAPGAGGELDALAAATGGSVQPLSSDGANIAAAILAGLSNLPVNVSMASDCVAPVSTSFAPALQTVTSGTDAVFVETISVAAGAAGGTYTCKDWALINSQPMTNAAGAIIYENKTINVPGIDLQPKTDTNELGVDLSHTVVATVSAGSYGPVAGVRVEFEIMSGPNAGATGVGVTNILGQASFTYTPPVNPAHLGVDVIEARFTNPADTVVYGADRAKKEWRDTTPPTAFCTPSVNPSGQNVPNAPGNGGKGQNQDGFYQLTATDLVWPASGIQMWVTDTGSGQVFGPFPVGTNIKYTQAPGATPSIKSMSGAVAWHIIGKGDAKVTATDGSGNTSAGMMCLVPPPPK